MEGAVAPRACPEIAVELNDPAVEGQDQAERVVGNLGRAVTVVVGDDDAARPRSVAASRSMWSRPTA